MRVVFIRHGQSTSNAGIPCPDLSMIELTERGWLQAGAVAEGWTARPSLIVTSPYLRTQQTAAPTIERFSEVQVETRPIQEFTYLEPSRWNGTQSEERMPHIVRYWQEADTAFCDGKGAESFSGLLERARATLERLQSLSSEALVYVFSYGQFIQAVRSLVIDADLSEQEKMRKFWRQGEPPAIATANSWHWSGPRSRGGGQARRSIACNHPERFHSDVHLLVVEPH